MSQSGEEEKSVMSPKTPLFVTHDKKMYYFYGDMEADGDGDRHGFFEDKETAQFAAHVLGLELLDVEEPREGEYDCNGVSREKEG